MCVSVYWISNVTNAAHVLLWGVCLPLLHLSDRITLCETHSEEVQTKH